MLTEEWNNSFNNNDNKMTRQNTHTHKNYTIFLKNNPKKTHKTANVKTNVYISFLDIKW